MIFNAYISFSILWDVCDAKQIFSLSIPSLLYMNLYFKMIGYIDVF